MLLKELTQYLKTQWQKPERRYPILIGIAVSGLFTFGVSWVIIAIAACFILSFPVFQFIGNLGTNILNITKNLNETAKNITGVVEETKKTVTSAREETLATITNTINDGRTSFHPLTVPGQITQWLASWVVKTPSFATRLKQGAGELFTHWFGNNAPAANHTKPSEITKIEPTTRVKRVAEKNKPVNTKTVPQFNHTSKQFASFKRQPVEPVDDDFQQYQQWEQSEQLALSELVTLFEPDEVKSAKTPMANLKTQANTKQADDKAPPAKKSPGFLDKAGEFFDLMYGQGDEVVNVAPTETAIQSNKKDKAAAEQFEKCEQFEQSYLSELLDTFEVGSPLVDKSAPNNLDEPRTGFWNYLTTWLNNNDTPLITPQEPYQKPNKRSFLTIM